MAETNNLKLALPTSNEYVDVEVLNENFRKIDTSILLALAAAAPYSAAATYAQGAYCTKGGKLYRWLGLIGPRTADGTPDTARADTVKN